MQQQLEDLIGSNPGEDPGGGLHKATEEMDEIIKDLKNNNITRKTVERQQKILSRMLDSQKSLTQKDFSKKRKNLKPDENIIYDSASELTGNKGQQELMLMDALENALQEGHSNEYQEIIKLYFHNLQKNEAQ